MQNITKKELLTVGLFSVFVFVAAVGVSFGGNYNLGPFSMINQYLAQTLSSKVQTVSGADTVKTAATAVVRTDTSTAGTTKTECDDGIDNDKDGDADANDYSCAKGTTEDSFEKGMTSQVATIMWPGGPRFVNRQQCYSYCGSVRKACADPLDAQRRQERANCLTGTDSNGNAYSCRGDTMFECADFTPARKPVCSRSTCLSCKSDVDNLYNPQIAQCLTNERSCRSNCEQMFPTAPSTATGPTIN